MNAAIRAVVKVAAEYGIEVFGIRHGYRGLIEGDMRELTTDEVRNIAHKGGTILKTARCKEFMVEEGQRRALLTAQAFDLEGIIAIGATVPCMAPVRSVRWAFPPLHCQVQ
mgnify:CR=1 FL=1